MSPYPRSSMLKLPAALLATAPLWATLPASLWAQNAAQPAGVSCVRFLAPARTANGKSAGQKDCRMQDVGIVDATHRYRRIDVGVSGTIAGWVTKTGARSNHFAAAPDFVFTQSGNPTPRFPGVLEYEAEKGTGFTLVYPEAAWNGKLFVTAHSGTGSFARGSLKPWDQNFDAAAPLAGLSLYEMAMLSKGYAVAVTRRNAQLGGPGDFSVTLDDGEVRPGLNVGMVPELILDMAILVENLLGDRMGREPSRTYFYGFSGGAMVGMVANYTPGLNRDQDGAPIFDGFIWDDAAGGLPLPVLMRDGVDVLFRSAAERAGFAKSIELGHLLYENRFTESSGPQVDVKNLPEWVSPDYLTNKANRKELLERKGLSDRYRIYGVASVSHSGGEYVDDQEGGDVEILPVWRLMEGVIDLLDRWVEQDVAPPPSRFALPSRAPAADAGIRLPDTACPLGVYHAYPPSRRAGGGTLTAFAPFDGQELEPLDGRGQFVDMNANGRHDQRETVTLAWRRLGLLADGASFDRARYVGCVEAAAAALKSAGFITAKTADLYLEEARTRPLPAR